MNAVASFLYQLWIDSPRRWHPILGVYYLTYACNLRCVHCSDGAGQPYPQLRSPTLPLAKVLDLLAIIRRHCDYLVLTGGEPFQHPDIGGVLANIDRLMFRGVILTTNGLGLDSLTAAPAAVTELVVSLQTMDSAKADRWYGQGSGTHRRVLAQIEQAARQPGRKFQVVISSVVTPDNIDDLYEVCRFARQRGFRLAACPQLLGVQPHPALVDNPKYRQFYDFLIAEKKRGTRIQGTVDYLEHLRDLRQFACRPFTMLVVAPTGEVFYPCLELGQFAGNLFDNSSLHDLRRQGLERLGPQPVCGVQCHSACALGFSRALANPLSILHEAAVMARSPLRTAR